VEKYKKPPVIWQFLVQYILRKLPLKSTRRTPSEGARSVSASLSRFARTMPTQPAKPLQ